MSDDELIAQVARGQQAALGALRVVRCGEALLVLGDDAFGPEPRTHAVRFCDATANLPAGIVALARIAAAPIVPFEVLPLAPRRWQVALGPVIEPPPRDSDEDGERRTLQELADHWTASIRRDPELWAARFEIDWQDEP